MQHQQPSTHFGNLQHISATIRNIGVSIHKAVRAEINKINQD